MRLLAIQKYVVKPFPIVKIPTQKAIAKSKSSTQQLSQNFLLHDEQNILIGSIYEKSTHIK